MAPRRPRYRGSRPRAPAPPSGPRWEAPPANQPAGAFWRSERRLRARAGGRVGLRDHLPDGEVHWPDGSGVGWAGGCWAVGAELTRKTVRRTAAIMHELLTR